MSSSINADTLLTVTATAQVTFVYTPQAPPPAGELRVPVGRRKVEIRNADLAPHVVMLDLREHSAVRIKHQFR